MCKHCLAGKGVYERLKRMFPFEWNSLQSLMKIWQKGYSQLTPPQGPMQVSIELANENGKDVPPNLD